MKIKLRKIDKYVEVSENAEKKNSIQLWNNKYFYGTFNSNFSLQNKKLKHLFEFFYSFEDGVREIIFFSKLAHEFYIESSRVFDE